ncbi:MAG: cation:proton antiporter [Chloroflexota bacterium]|nr:cation:proton antiporter [Chloroflexota bacterium]
MFEETELLRDLAIALSVALGGGWLAHVCRQPALVGYLVAGVIIGPYVLGLVEGSEEIGTIATLGIVLLLFTLGIKFSLRELIRLRYVAIGGGILQMFLSAVLGVGIASILGWSVEETVVLAIVIGLSSTMVVISLLSDRGELHSVHGRVMIGILLVQDIAAALAMFILPTLGTDSDIEISSILFALLNAAIFLVGVLILGFWIVPPFIRRVARRGSRELFIISSAALCFGSAYGAHYMGLSAGLGAFAVGLVISESDFAHQVIGDTSPLRDTFSALFFVAVGMLLDISFVADNIGTILFVVAAIVATKFMVSSAVTRLFRYTGKTVPLVGAGIFQIGEFSLVLAELSRSNGGISEDIYSIILASAMITIMLTPPIFAITSRLVESRWLASAFPAEKHPAPIQLKSTQHVVICGYGRVGSGLAQALTELEIPFTVIDLDPGVISHLRSQKVPCVYGDAGNMEVLSRARLSEALLLVIATPDPVAARQAVDNARRINPRLHIMARVHTRIEMDILQNQGVFDMVQPEVEASIELVRHILCHMGIPPDEVSDMLGRWRNKCPIKDYVD